MAYYNVAAAQPAHAFAQPGFAQPQWPQAAVANPWMQAGHMPVYGQHPAGAWAQVTSPAGFGHPAAAYPYGQVAQPSEQYDPVDLFMQQLGIQPEEDVYFSFIAEYALQDEVLPSRWQVHRDPSLGRDYYVDSDSGTSSWEHPLTQCLQSIVQIGRVYLQRPTDNFFRDQKEALWDEHKRELDCWHGPLADGEGRQYFSNSSRGISSWHDPREETQFIFEVESNLLDALKDTLPVLGPEDLPTFGCSDKGEDPPEPRLPVSPSPPHSPHSPQSPHSQSSRGAARQAKSVWERVAEGVEKSRANQRSIFEKMMETADYVNYIQRDSWEAQHLMITRKLRERQNRKRRIVEAEVRARKEEEAIRKALADAEEEKKAEILRQMREEQQRAEDERQRKLAEEEAERKEEERRVEEERQRVLAEKEAARKAEEKREREEAEKARKEKEARDLLLARLREAPESHDLAVLRAAIADGEAAGLTSELEPVRAAFKREILASFQSLIDSRDVNALRSAIADGEAMGFSEDELAPVRKALEDELARRKSERLKARKAKEELAAQFKTQKEAHELGGAILVAQWKAAVREVAKPFEE